MSAATLPAFSIHEFLRQEREKDLLRFSTAGSVDDGKSTLIGRLLYDTQSVYDDQVRSIEGKGTTAPGQLDFALLTDGLRAEREQGITIDVAYRYFSTAHRKFIIADTPGHEQYTRNMATGASTADVAVVLIDATKGVLVQSRRHAYIASLLRVRNVLVAVNKMDLVDYDETAFRAVARDFATDLDRIAENTGTSIEAAYIPVSALIGDNVVSRSNAMPWYDGPTLLELLESLPASDEPRAAPFRFPVQRVLRPDHNYRGFAGQIASGTIRPGDAVTVASSGRTAAVERIVTWDGDLAEAHAPLSATLVLDRDLDISRGDLIASHDRPPSLSKSIKASLVWMDQRPLELSRRYLLKHTSRTVPAFLTSIDHRANIATLTREPAETLEMNSIGVVNLSLLQPVAVDVYRENRSTGAFILIDPVTNATVAAGMIVAVSDRAAKSLGPVTSEERLARFGHHGGVLELTGPETLIDQVERSLFELGAVTVRIDPDTPGLTQTIVDGGLIALIARTSDSASLTARSGAHSVTPGSGDVNEAVHRLLIQSGIFDSVKADHP
ncbi:MAG TPA: sulfate adenylyltransferase subunit CysN [Silvibacterium sp.]|nr:sulfate adenylyltransferase subunit CysN [Silvibacterium sp.]